MLPAIQRDHLTGHGRSVKDKTDRGTNLLRFRTALQDCGFPLFCECLFRLPGIGKRRTRDDGVIINILDQRVWKLTPDFFSYTLSKSALWTATQTLAQGLAPKVRVNAIGPGPTLANSRQSVEAFEQQQKSTILQRGADPSEICSAIRFILDAPSMTGQMALYLCPAICCTSHWCLCRGQHR